MANFRRPPQQQPVAATPEQLFYQLPRGAGHATLWSHQADVLRSYEQIFKDKRDVAIELPTGTGKTLPGLLLADWNRRTRTARVVFACPTVQLVKQVLRAANRQGISAVDLSGSWHTWDDGDKMRFEQAQAMAIVTYSSIFNARPHLESVDTIIFDDAHAAEQYVAGAFSLEITRAESPEMYEAARARLSPALPDGIGPRLADENPEVVGRTSVNLVLPGLHDGLADALEEDLRANIVQYQGAYWPYQLLKGHFDACMVYVTWRQILIRPFIPPTFENELFFGARQRIYLSATLGNAGELERAFGRARIDRLPLPESAGTPRSGRRFIVFPTLVKNANPLALARALEEKSDRAIVLTPSNFGIEAAKECLVPLEWSVFMREQVEDSFDDFAATQNAISILANRYDGIDLPNDSCRVVTLRGFPRATHLQEEFLSSRAKAAAAIAERIRSRIVQGTGRCTRSPEDFALVLIADPDTASYLARPDVRKTLDPALQAEIEFGIENSGATQDEVTALVDSFLAQDDDWQSIAEEWIAEIQSARVREAAPGSGSLAHSVNHEVRACELAWQGVWGEASAEASQAAQELAGDDEVRPYRAFWLLLAGYDANVAARRDPGSSIQISERLAKLALEAAQPQSWVRELTPFPGLPEEPLPAHDVSAVNFICNEISRTNFNEAKNIAELAEMRNGLRATDPGKYERALTVLGRMLGADAFKPGTQANCDSAWCWDNHMWLTIEAKSDESPNAALSVEAVRQANSHLTLLAVDRGRASIPLPYAASVIVSPRTSISPEAITIAHRPIHLVSLAEMIELGNEVQHIWSRLRQLRGLAPDELADQVTSVLRRASLLPSKIFERLSMRPVASD